MANMLFTVSLTLFAVAQVQITSAEQFGICVETCSINPLDSDGFGPCPEGTACKSTGCGHTCQHVTVTQKKKAEFGSCIEACSPVLHSLGVPSCPLGTVCKSNGCGHTCQPDTDVAKRQKCGPVLCKMYCANGYALDDNGCEICRCKE